MAAMSRLVVASGDSSGLDCRGLVSPRSGRGFRAEAMLCGSATSPIGRAGCSAPPRPFPLA